MAIIETASGKVEGFEKRGVLQFRGIPYAAPPVGDLRWRAPQAPKPWADTFQAFEFSPIAPQAPSPFHTAFGAQPPPSDEGSCLTLNVWTPACDGARRPVMLWYHGGSYVLGDGRTPWYDGVHLARDRDVVVVTCNYRLGALGYLHLGDVAGPGSGSGSGSGDDEFAGSGNCGLLDQVAVLRWVHENITAFGGDPGNVTIFGESAGAMSTSTLLGTPAAAGLFHRAIPQSGALAHVHPDRDAATAVAREFLDALGIAPADVKALRDIPTERLLEAQDALVQKQFGGGGQGIGIVFMPTVDDVVLAQHPLDAVAAGSAAGVPLLTGCTAEEMRLFTAFASEISQLDDDTLAARMGAALGDGFDHVVDAYRQELGRDHLGAEVTKIDLWSAILTDRVFRVPCLRLLEAHAPHAPAAYCYEFAFQSPAMGGVLGASHAVDIPFTFDNLTAPGAMFFVGEPTPEMQTLATGCGDAWAAFARAGTPVPPREGPLGPGAAELPDWPAWEPTRAATMVLGLEPAVADDPWAFTRTVWADLA
ncbi:MAG: carboxylesterase/lipase family protein [Actinobacteria bacterium]|nr:carboxylesterase/lipase family protein [Actinomycetota bacterium]